jgi:AcrR family transcriptional regulator
MHTAGGKKSVRDRVPLAESAGVAALGRRERRKAVTKAELLRAGRTLFSRAGLYESRIEDLTETAGIAKGTFYLYFDRKEDLALAVVEEGFAELGALVDARASEARSLEAIVARIVEAHVSFFSENPDLMRIFHQARGALKFDRSEWRPLRRALNAHLARLSDHFLRVSPSERPSSSQRAELASIVFGGVSGALSVRLAADAGAAIPSRMPALVAAFAALAHAFAPDAAGRRSR